MDTSTFVALSGQLALDKRLATLANNIANAKTAGYRASGVSFEAIVSNTAAYETAFSSTGANHLNLASGALTRTGNPLDVAIKGDAFFAMQGPNGKYYSRDGRLSLTMNGEVVNTLGHPVLDVGGAPMAIDTSAGSPDIGKDGTLFQRGARVGQIGLFTVDISKGFVRSEGSGVIPTAEAETVVDFSRTGLSQGFIEESNVSAITEMVKLIQVTRAFEAASTLSDKALESEMAAIDALGAR